MCVVLQNLCQGVVGDEAAHFVEELPDRNFFTG